jgi:hypothetical protein
MIRLLGAGVFPGAAGPFRFEDRKRYRPVGARSSAGLAIRSSWWDTGAARSGKDLRARVKAHEDAGIDEVLLDPTVPALDQVDRAADVVFG